MLDVVVVGSGPNGLTAAAVLAQAGRSVLIVEASHAIGGGTRTEELTLPGHLHDVCSAVHPLGAASPAFRSLDLAAHGLEWIHPPVALAHPLDDGTAVALHRSIDDTAAGLGPDGAAWQSLVGPLVRSWDAYANLALGPIPRAVRHPLRGLRLGSIALPSADRIARRFDTDRARALFAGLAAHAIAPLDALGTGGIGVVLAAAGHAVGWPVAAGGSGAIAEALTALLATHGVQIETNRMVAAISELPRSEAVVLDTSPGAAARIAGPRLRRRTRRRLSRYRHGSGAFKVDLVLDGPVPWVSEAAKQAGTIHVGGTFEQIAEAEARTAAGEMPDRPFVLVSQQSRFDPSRAPDGHEVVWAYAHVPKGFDADVTDHILGQIERFAPGFRDRILARHVMSPSALEAHNPNYVGGDIAGGAVDLRNLILRPRPALDPYKLGDGVWLCSSSTPPGAGVHGMCGWHAARSVLRSTRDAR